LAYAAERNPVGPPERPSKSLHDEQVLIVLQFLMECGDFDTFTRAPINLSVFNWQADQLLPAKSLQSAYAAADIIAYLSSRAGWQAAGSIRATIANGNAKHPVHA